MLLETDASLRAGDTISVDLPGADRTNARIVWGQDAFFGCAFKEPIPTAAISSVLLQIPLNERSGRSQEPQYEEFSIAFSPTLDELANWKSDFERTKGMEGYRIIAYRQTTGGLLIAIAAKSAKD